MSLMKFWTFFTQQELQRFTIMHADKFPGRLNEDMKIQYDIGVSTELCNFIEMDITQELLFIPLTKILLGGIDSTCLIQRHSPPKPRAYTISPVCYLEQYEFQKEKKINPNRIKSFFFERIFALSR